MEGSQGFREDSLERMFRMQRELAAMMDASRYPEGREARVSALCTAMIHEAVELQRTTDWKWWKERGEFDEAAAREELIDVWHFAVQAAIELGMTPQDVLDEYGRKHGINVRRQRDGY
ncbi:MAG: dUTPase [Thaumarchaeota archaeon]|nr:dUTPase [Nitrososphaerota archaeon]